MGSVIQAGQVKQDKPLPYRDDNSVYTKEHAQALDQEDPLRHFREEFIIPSKADLKSQTLPNRATRDGANGTSEPCIYLCGNSLGLQPKRTSQMIRNHLDTWAMKGVHGHFDSLNDSSLPSWTQADDVAAEAMAPIVGALPSEVAVMGTLTANLHLLMCSFYLPTKERPKIIMESKAFPSDHFAVESQIRMHNLDPADAMILIEPKDPLKPFLTTEQILSVVDTHASTTALLLLPGIQYYTGQLFDIPRITAYAKAKGIVVGWDLAHAAGNVELKLHDWDVDFAAWCNYKYLNSGPGAIAGLFVHEMHGQVDRSKGDKGYRPRLSGWWGGDKSVRFQMDNNFVPIPGAAGFQVSNPSAIDLVGVTASLSLFNRATLPALRQRSLRLTGYLENLLLNSSLPSLRSSDNERPFSIITPSTPESRGAQLSILLKPGLLDTVMRELTEAGVVVDERKPDVVRVAPAPLYNSFEDCWGFVQILGGAIAKGIGEMDKTGKGKSKMEGEVLTS